MNAEVAQRLANARRARGITQEELANRLGVSRQAVSNWERGETSPDTDNLIALAHIYHMSLDELLGIDAPHPGEDAITADDASGEAYAAREEEQPAGPATAGQSAESDPESSDDSLAANIQILADDAEQRQTFWRRVKWAAGAAIVFIVIGIPLIVLLLSGMRRTMVILEGTATDVDPSTGAFTLVLDEPIRFSERSPAYTSFVVTPTKDVEYFLPPETDAEGTVYAGIEHADTYQLPEGAHVSVGYNTTAINSHNLPEAFSCDHIEILP